MGRCRTLVTDTPMVQKCCALLAIAPDGTHRASGNFTLLALFYCPSLTKYLQVPSTKRKDKNRERAMARSQMRAMAKPNCNYCN